MAATFSARQQGDQGISTQDKRAPRGDLYCADSSNVALTTRSGRNRSLHAYSLPMTLPFKPFSAHLAKGPDADGAPSARRGARLQDSRAFFAP